MPRKNRRFAGLAARGPEGAGFQTLDRFKINE
ncbi:MAG: hypothetical protein QOI13_808, partial [Paraburkholderia sp.]|nr:hypothetical protein [Paraburkholderia sp.]